MGGELTIKSVLDKGRSSMATVHEFQKVSDVIHLFNRLHCNVAVVEDDHKQPCGIVTEHDLIRSLGEHDDSIDLPVNAVMSFDLVVVNEETPLKEAMKMMSDHKMQYLPVVDESGHLRNFVNMMDVMTTYMGAIK